MRENHTYGSEGGESGSTGLPYAYRDFTERLVMMCLAGALPRLPRTA
jgi:hypothetical protein